jgi:hypothetical protein
MHRGARARATRGALGVEGALYLAAADVRYLLLAPLLRLQNGRLHFWPPCARAASQEMRELANDCRTLLEKSGVEAPALRRLYRAIDAYAA